MAPDPIPTLVYDGDCGICRRWVDYWSELTGDRVRYRPYQQAAAEFPHIPLDDFRRSIQLIEAPGVVHAGAAATFRVLRHARERGIWWWMYRWIPGFAPLSELAYAFLAARRGLLARLTSLLWGTPLEPPRYDLVRRVFIRGLGLVYLVAFASLLFQVRGLVGSDGLLPATTFLDAVREQVGRTGWLLLPSVFWIDARNAMLVGGTIAGMALALFVIIGWWTRIALVGLFVLYLSYVHVGQEFLLFQWDLLLVETGFLAMFLPYRSRIVVWLFRWLTFRYVLMAGAAKIVSGDAAWRGLTALQHHFETQPLPTPLAWHAAQLPSSWLAAGTWVTLAIEVGLVFLVFAPRRPRMLAAWSILLLQILIALTGNYNFFNALTMLLCLFLFDDKALRTLVPSRVATRLRAGSRPASRASTLIAAALLVVIVPAGIYRLGVLLFQYEVPVASTLSMLVSPLYIVNHYGLFAMMTTTRPEIVIEGSDDGVTWQEYAFRYKPGDVSRRPPWNAPHQPRLDWHMWFLALRGDPNEAWFIELLRALLENRSAVVALLGSNPFPEHPPKHIRALLYDYRFTDAATRAATGQWWTRRLTRELVPAVSLENFAAR